MREESVERFIAAAERMHLEDYVRFQSDRKRRLLDAFTEGMVRGLGIMVGFSVLGAAMLYALQDVAERNLPGISSFVARVVTLVQMRLQ